MPENFEFENPEDLRKKKERELNKPEEGGEALEGKPEGGAEKQENAEEREEELRKQQEESGKKREGDLEDIRERIGGLTGKEASAGSSEKPPVEKFLEISGEELKRLGFEDLSGEIMRTASWLQEREQDRLSPLVAPEGLDKIRAAGFSLAAMVEQNNVSIQEITVALSEATEAMKNIGEARARAVKEKEDSLTKGANRIRGIGEKAREVNSKIGGEKREESEELKILKKGLENLAAAAQEKFHLILRKREAFLEYSGRR